MKPSKIYPPKFDFKNIALYHISTLRYNIYNDVQLFENSNYVGKELICYELETLYHRLTNIEEELKQALAISIDRGSSLGDEELRNASFDIFDESELPMFQPKWVCIIFTQRQSFFPKSILCV